MLHPQLSFCALITSNLAVDLVTVAGRVAIVVVAVAVTVATSPTGNNSNTSMGGSSEPNSGSGQVVLKEQPGPSSYYPGTVSKPLNLPEPQPRLL